MREVTDLKGFTEVSAAQISLDILIIPTEEYRNTVTKPQIHLMTLQFPYLFCNKPFRIFSIFKKKTSSTRNPYSLPFLVMSLLNGPPGKRCRGLLFECFHLI